MTRTEKATLARMSEQLNLETITLEKGAHASFAKGVCAMELVSYIAGEPFSDHPKCTSPVLAAFSAGGTTTSTTRGGSGSSRICRD